MAKTSILKPGPSRNLVLQKCLPVLACFCLFLGPVHPIVSHMCIYIYIYLEKIIRSVLLLRDVNGSGKRLKAPSLLLKGRESRVLKHLSWCILQPAPNNYAGKNAVNVS